MEQPYLQIAGITKKFGSYVALNKIDISVSKGEFVCLLGPSGCGKTTLLRIIAGLEEPTEGRVFLGGRDITSLHPSKRNFGIVFQSYALFPNMTASQNIAFGLKSRKVPKEEISRKVLEVLRLVKLEQEKDKYPAQLSGGQQQRVALARALALSPEFLLLDEPLSALDAKVRVKLRRDIRHLQEKLGITTIMVTHDQEEALTMADRIVVMNKACIEQHGTPQEVYDNPKNPFVADFIGAINFFYKDISEQGLEAVKLMYDNKYKIKAIRPEYVRIVEKETNGCIGSIVEDVEFRGSFYRVTLKLKENAEAYKSDYLTVDLPSNFITKNKVRAGMQLDISLPEDKLIFYNLDTDVDDIVEAG